MWEGVKHLYHCSFQYFMAKIFIIHGTKGSSGGNWFPWLRRELELLGHTVFVPDFPTPENQNLQSWMDAFEDYLHLIDNDTILVGHSLGPAFLLSVLERIPEPVKAAFFVVGFIGPLGLPEFDALNKTFTEKRFDWTTIRNNCKKFYVINSDNDPYVPLEKGKELAKNLKTEVMIIKNAGHINAESGFTKFPLLLEKIKQILKPS